MRGWGQGVGWDEGVVVKTSHLGLSTPYTALSLWDSALTAAHWSRSRVALHVRMHTYAAYIRMHAPDIPVFWFDSLCGWFIGWKN